MKKLLVLSVAVIVMLGFSACNSTDEPALNNDYKEVKVNKEVKVLSHEDFTNENDVTVSNNGVTVSVSNDFLASQGLTIEKGNILSIWSAINTMPLIRNVESFEVKGDRTIIKTSNGNLADVITDGEFFLSCDPYVNAAETGEARYKSDARTYHPVVVIRHDEGKISGDFVTAEQVAARGEYPFNYTLFEETYEINKTFSDPKNIVSVGVTDGYVKPSAKLDFYLRIENLAIQEFHALFTGAVEASLPFAAKADATYKWSIDKTLYELPKPLTFVFKIGAVPVEVSVNTKILFEANANAKAQFGATMPFKYKGSFTAGPKYNRANKDNGYKGWEFYRQFTQKKEGGIEALTVNGEASINASAGLYLQVNAMVYGAAGPSLKIGPRFTTTNTVVGLGVPNRFNLTSKGEFQIEGAIGAHLTLPVVGEILNNGNLADWTDDFILFHANLWEVNRSIVLNKIVINYGE